MPEPVSAWRGPGPGRPAVPLPPDRMPGWRGGRPLKRWTWVGAFGPELMLCAAVARIGPATAAWWAVWDRAAKTFEQCDPRNLEKAARTGDGVAKGLWDAIGDEIGAALANVVWTVNPDVIVIGGGVAKAGDILFEPIRHSVCSRTVKLFHEQLRIIPAELGNDAGAIGNAALVLDSLGTSGT